MNNSKRLRIRKTLFWSRFRRNFEIDIMRGEQLCYILAFGRGRGISIYQISGLYYQLIKRYF